MDLSLHGKTILVTGVSRASGIGASIAKHLSKQGARVLIHGNSDFDVSNDYDDADPNFNHKLVQEDTNIHTLPGSDLSIGLNCEALIEKAVLEYGHLDGLVLNHAYSTQGAFGDLTEASIQKHLNTNVTGSLLLIQAFAKQLPQANRGAITLFTSGQYLGSMVSEIAYAVSKEAIIGITKQAAYALASQNIQVNAINPGPTDTGYATGDDYQAVQNMFPMKRWGMPDDAARLVTFLQSDASHWITGQIIASEGGFKR